QLPDPGQPAFTGGAPEQMAEPADARDQQAASFQAATQGQDVVEQQLDAIGGVIRSALTVEVRDGRIRAVMPTTERLEDYLDLVGAVEVAAAATRLPVQVEGYGPPPDPRLDVIRVGPDPGVIEVNIHPAADWRSCVETTATVYEEACQSRLGA